MSVREYIGARYVPVFSDPIQWDITLGYEPLTVVMNQGTSYVSKQYVPEGIAITNETYWLRWADYNAQLEEYIRQVQTFDGRITANTDAIESLGDDLETFEETVTADNWVTNSRIADNAVDTAEIADDAVTGAKIADNAITSDKIVNKTIVAADIADHTITAQQLQNPFVVVFGDSWTDESVQASKWVPTLRSMYPNATVKNYAVNGCHHSNGSFENMYNAFTNDTTIDKSLITHVVLLYGVNDQYTYPIASPSDEADIIKNFYNTIISQIPADVQIQWVINHTYGIASNPWSTQYDYWLRTIQMIGASCPRMTPHESASWFNYSEYNSTNWFHLTEAAQRNHLAKNMRSIIFGDGALIKYPTVNASPTDSANGIQIRFDIQETCIVGKVKWNSVNSVVNQYQKTLDHPVPETLDVFKAIPFGDPSHLPHRYAHLVLDGNGTYATRFTLTIGQSGDNIPAGSTFEIDFFIPGF